jgi:hypothetical protein
MKNKLFLSILAAFGLAGAAQAQTTTFVDVANLGEGVDVITSGGTVKVNATVLTKNQRWTRDRVYILANNVIVPAGVTLTIEPGTLIRAEQSTVGQGSGAEAALTPADPGALVVARGGRLIAAGTADAPIIFTSMDDPNVPGGIATIPVGENLGAATNATTTTNTATNGGSRVHSIMNTTASNMSVIWITSSTGGLTTNTVTPNNTLSFTNYLFGTGTNTNYYRLNGTTTNWYATPTLTTTFTNLAAARTLKTGVSPVVLATNSQGRAGIYTLTGTGTLTASAKGYGAWAANGDSAFRHDGMWGGIVMAGYGTVVRGYNSGVNANGTNDTVVPTIDPATGVVSGTQRGVQQIEGMAGFATYAWGGGDVVNPPDDSGILRFISNRYGGFVIAVNAELNSYSFYGVGRATVLEFLEAWNNADDDFEFWGGDVNLRYALSLFCGDDGLDTDQGYLGAVQYFVQIQNNATGNADGTSLTGRSTANYGDSLTENDGPESDNKAVPLSTYILANATLVGRGYASAGSYVSDEPYSGPNFRDNAGARWHNSIIMDSPNGAVLITDRNSTTNTDVTNALAGSSIGRYAHARTSGGFDGANRAANLQDTQTNGPGVPDGRFHSCVFFRNGLAKGSANGMENGKYSNNAAFQTAYGSDTNYHVASTAALFPAEHRRNSRGASSDGNTNRANTAAVVLQLTNATNYNSFSTDPGLGVNPYTRLSGLNLRPTNGAARSLGNSAIPDVRGLNTNATFAGAVLDNAWMKGWTLSDKLGLWAGTQYVPEVKITLSGLNPKVTFGAEANIRYVVERSGDNKTYVPIATVPEGPAGNVEVTDPVTVGTSPVFYRVIAL